MSAPGDPVGDALTGGNGDDRFHTRDGEVDRIDCGDDRDVALLDQFDVIVDASATNANGSCERVVRSAALESDAEENKAQSPSEDKKEDGKV